MTPTTPPPPAPLTTAEIDQRTIPAWFLSFSAAMVPFCAFCYGHSLGMTTRVVDRVVRSPVGVYGLFALPFVTLGMEKSIYDTVQAWQGLDPNVIPSDRGGFPSGGAGERYSWFSFLPFIDIFVPNRKGGRLPFLCARITVPSPPHATNLSTMPQCDRKTQSCHRSA
jgi:hypothetical protein